MVKFVKQKTNKQKRESLSSIYFPNKVNEKYRKGPFS